MPSDSYTLIVSDASIAAPHASTHGVAGADAVSISATQVTAGTLPVLRGGTGVTTSTGSGSNVLSSGPILTAPVLGTPAAGSILTNCTGLPLATGVSGTLPVGSGGTGVTTSTGSGDNVLSTSPILTTPVLGTPAAGSILTNCTGLPVTTGVTGLGTGVATFLATPSSANLATAVTGETGSGALVFATSPTLDTPNLGIPTAGVLTSCTGLPVTTGVTGLGTGVATFLATPSSANLATAVTGETGSGALVFATSPTLTTPVLGTPASGNLTNCTGFPVAGVSGLGTGVATFLATPSSANLAAAVTGETGSGALVFATSPTLTTPVLGTPASGNLTNCTGFPVAGVSGLGTGVATFLATPSSANLAAAVTGETGSGALVFATSPTLVTPNLGTPTAGVLTSCTGLPLTTGVTGVLPIDKGGTNSSTGVDLTAALVTGILPISKGGTGNTTGTSVIGETDTLSFKTTGQTTDALATGELRWNGEDKTLDLKLAGDVTLQVGQENNIYVHNAEPVNTIPNGSVVYIYGADGNNPAVKLATNADFTASKTLGVATQSITAGSHGYITTQGLVRGLDTSAFSSGDSLWLGVGGVLTATEPVFPATSVRVALVVRDDVSLGSIFVQPQLFSDGRVSGQFSWLTNTTSGPTISVVGMTSSSNVIIQERDTITPAAKSYSTLCSSGSFVPYSSNATNMSGLSFSYIAFI